MNKKYLLLFVCGLLLSFTNAMAAVGNGVIKIKTNASKGQKIKMEMFIFGGWDEDGDALDNSPVYGDNFSVDGASNVTAAGNKVVMTADGPEITIHGDVDYLSIVGQGVTYIDVSKATELYELRVNENPITSIDLSNAPRRCSGQATARNSPPSVWKIPRSSREYRCREHRLRRST